MSWQRIRGHDNQVKAFREAQRRGRLAHAYLFAGPPGVGKRTFATELAKALLCEKPLEADTSGSPQLEACDKCPGCIQVAAGTHPDFFVVNRPEDKLEMPIETVRELCRVLALKPARGRGKVAILDDADDLNDESANCFLKTLEEPPPGSVLILIAASPDRQLATILSRCQVIRFQPLPEKEVAEVLKAQGVEEKEIARLARRSGGSPGQAVALADPALWDFRKTLLLGLARPKADTVELAQKFSHFVEEAGKEAGPQRRRATLVVGLLVDFLNDALRLSQGAIPAETEPEYMKALQQLAGRLGPDRLLQLLDRCLEADRHIDRRVQLVLVLEALLDALGQKVGA